MKILYDNSIFFKQSYGGISKYFIKLFNSLNKKDEVNFLISHGIHKNEYLKSFHSKSYFFKKYPLLCEKIFSRLNNYNLKKNNLIFKPDIIHYTYYGPQISKKCKSILTVYDLTHEKFYKKYGFKKPYFNYRKKIFDHVDAIISISENTKKDLIDIYKINESKINTIYLGIDNNLGKSTNLSSSKNQNPYMLYVGNRSKHKNFISVIKAYAKSKKINNNFEFLCFGGGNFNSYEKSLFSELNVSNKVKQVSGDDFSLNESYKNASLLVYPTLYEGFGLPPMEAIQNGCPVLISNVESLKEIYGDSVIYTDDPLNIEEWIQNIEIILFQKKITEEFLIKGKKRIELFSWNKCADQTKNLYQKLLSKI